ncbi:Hsp70 family protein [uncultured Cytophaga sp.]|uniref:Hsp70 family protein n=1 Tax=uncultured Cytophaga sp. TaxID=160238 RepID=UPI00262E420B|nr:Hsp70 family protein [uncultured Cytophaga sp.]
MSKHLYGIDFGTSNSVLCIFDEETNELINTITVPSILYFPNDFDVTKPISYFIGEEAITNYVKDGMKGRFMKSIKRVLPRSNFTETRIHTKSYNASDLISLILKDLKQKADSIVGYDCKKAIIGRPVFFDEDNSQFDSLAQKRLLKAADIAGLTDVRFQFEPIGAAFAYEKTISKKEHVLVADLGGGTTDFTFIKLDPNRTFEKDRRKDILATGGIYIGGDSFDSALMWDKGTPNFGRGLTYESMPGKQVDVPPSFFSNICSWEKMNFFNGLKVQNDLRQYYSYTNQNKKIKNLITLTENNLGYSIFQSIEKTKVELSKKSESTFEYHALDIDIEEHLSVTDYNSIIGKDIVKIKKYLLLFLEQNDIKLTDIDTLFITGGSSLVLAVQDLFKSVFPNTPIKSDDNFVSVAKGLAYSGYLFE